ncbi:hypothetical protein GGR52DRAFT_545427 [Hypoxylon sp. FL1284]|nr:hypothetical protein GGR52DRAFT_545427 [Hypoxylon sp. FL1284]
MCERIRTEWHNLPSYRTRSRNGRSGEKLDRRSKSRILTSSEKSATTSRGRKVVQQPPVRTQRTALQTAPLSHVKPSIIQLSKTLTRSVDKEHEGVDLYFEDGSIVTAGLVVGADGIRSVRLPPA